MEFVVKRSKWRAGDDGVNAIGKGETNLLNEEGFMCCLGHCALQLGAKKSEIDGQAMPKDILDKNDAFKYVPILNVKKGEFINDSKLSEQAATINDDDKLTTEQRERKLKSLFSKFKHSITFVGKAVPFKSA